jgi:hypothetical protein
VAAVGTHGADLDQQANLVDRLEEAKEQGGHVQIGGIRGSPCQNGTVASGSQRESVLSMPGPPNSWRT